ncbi:MAG: hypothetical protein QM831_36700 [Kofleriaceae bacterium]
MRCLVITVVGLVSCKEAPPAPQPATHAPEASTELRWTNADGSLLAATHGTSVDGACGPIATFDGTAVTFPDDGRKISYAEIPFKDGVLSPPGMTFEIHVSPTGDVTQHYTSGSGGDVPSGKITPLADAAARDRFRAMFAAVSLRREPEIALNLPVDQVLFKYKFEDIVDAKGDRVFLRDDDRIVKTVTVTHTSTGFDVVVDGVDKNVGGNFRATKFSIVEKPDGTLSFGDTPFAKLVNRRVCPFDDTRAGHLIEQLFWTHDGLERLRDAGLPEPPPPPPPPPPKPRH